MKIWTHLRKSRRTEIVGGFRLCTIVLSHSVSMEPPDDNHTYCLPENDLSSQKCEKIAGEKENSVWLIMNNKYILHKLREFKNGNVVWECKFRRALACPFKCETSESDDLLWSYLEASHTCAQDPIEVEVYRFKLEVKEKMRSDYRATYSVVYNTTKNTFWRKLRTMICGNWSPSSYHLK